MCGIIFDLNINIDFVIDSYDNIKNMNDYVKEK